MKQITKLLAISLIILSMSLMCTAEIPDSTKCADALNSLGLFSGTDKGYELENDATRVQIAVTFTRLLGKESKAAAQKNPHPFKDVPSWAGDCIGYLYEEYLVNGTSDTTFGSNDKATAAQFTTMLLRALGYSDSGSNADFSYNNALNFAVKANMFDESYKALLESSKTLSRGNMVTLSYLALKTPLKNSYKTLSQKLCYEQKLFDENSAISAGVMTKYTTENYFYGIEVIHPSFDLIYDNNIFKGTMESPLETFGLTLYASSDGNEYKELIQGTDWTMSATHYTPAGALMLDEFTVSNPPQFKDSITFVILKKTSKTYLAKFNGTTPFVTYTR